MTSTSGGAPLLPVRIAAVPGAVSSLAWSNGLLWAADGRRVLRIDPVTLHATGSLIAAQCEDSQITAGLAAIWVVSGDCADPGVLSKLDPHIGRVVWQVRIPAMAVGVATWRGSVWVTTLGKAHWTLARVDPTTRRVPRVSGTLGGAITTGPNGDGLTTLVAAGSGLWAEPSGFGGIAHLIPTANHVTGRILYTTDEKHGLAYGASTVWAALGTQVLQLDPTSEQLLGPSIQPPSQITAITYGDSELWIATDRKDVYRWPGAGPLVRVAHLPWPATTMIVGGGYLWATSYTSGQIAHIGPTPIP